MRAGIPTPFMCGMKVSMPVGDVSIIDLNNWSHMFPKGKQNVFGAASQDSRNHHIIALWSKRNSSFAKTEDFPCHFATKKDG
jgi:hypothetical protein